MTIDVQITTFIVWYCFWQMLYDKYQTDPTTTQSYIFCQGEEKIIGKSHEAIAAGEPGNLQKIHWTCQGGSMQ